MSKKNEEKQILFLTMLITASVAINLSLILLIHLNNAESPASAIVKTFTGNTPMDIFTKEVLMPTPVAEETTTVVTPSPETITPIPEPVPQPVPIPQPTPPAKTTVIVDPVVMPVPYAYYDYNKDGNMDLVRKEVDGNYYVYYNQGTNDNKIFREGTKLNSLDGKSLIENYGVKSTSSVTTPAETQSWTYILHPRYDLYIDSAYYASNTPAIDNFFNEFDERFALLESTTKWSSEKYSTYGTKLKINVSAATPGGCYGGSAYSGNVNIRFSNPLYMSGCEMAYYKNGTPYFSNPGELEDWWEYMSTAVHESLHGINPPSILIRPWLTEGFSEYYQYNILSNYNGNGYLDINQETSDTYIYQGTSYYNWPGYVANDYHDTSPSNAEIQSSPGYDITAWMFSMMRDNYSLNWANFYKIIDNNKETNNEAVAMYLASGTSLPSDMYAIDLFGRASNLDFPATKRIWQYNLTAPAGWGVRNWEPLDWYADLTPTNLSFSKTNPVGGETVQINTNISNTGQTNANNVSVRFYKNNTLINEQFVNFTAQSSKIVSTSFAGLTQTYLITVKVDESNTKIETNDSNNNYTKSITFSVPPSRPSCWYDKRRRAYTCA